MKPAVARFILFAVAAAVLAALPFAASNYVLRLATIGFMYVTLASSWNLLGGFAGYPSFAIAAFFGLGAYGGAVLRTDLGLALPVAWLAGAAIAGVFALCIGPAILRLRGHYFAVASLVLAPVLREIVNSATTLTGGGMGLNLPASAVLPVAEMARLYYVSMLMAASATVGLAIFIAHSRLGWALRCIEQNEDAAAVLGINALAAKVTAFAASAATAGLAGAIYATWIGYIDPSDVFNDLLSIKPIVMAFLGGIGTVLGPILGALAYLGLEETLWRNLLNFHAGILGLLIVVLLVYLPGGLGGWRGYTGQIVALARRFRWPRHQQPARSPVAPS
jgi:branched-chain amino acid transport system permease protein